MPRFFTTEFHETSAVITGEDARHIARVLRSRVGDELTVCDLRGSDCRCRIEALSDAVVRLTVLERTPTEAEPSVRVHLYQALPKADKLELIVQKAVELGVTEITPVLTRRCVSRPDERSAAKKLERYRRIACEAAKQCGRGILPEGHPTLPYARALEEAAQAEAALLLYEKGGAALREQLAQRPATVSLIVGAEGGFDPQEAQQAQEAGIRSIGLGARILRCETAPIAALAVIMYETGNLE